MHQHNNHASGLGAWAITGIVAGTLVSLLFAWAYVRVIRRAGYSGWWVLIGLVPAANIICFLLFAFKEWPIQRELRQLRAWAGQDNRATVRLHR